MKYQVHEKPETRTTECADCGCKTTFWLEDSIPLCQKCCVRRNTLSPERLLEVRILLRQTQLPQASAFAVPTPVIDEVILDLDTLLGLRGAYAEATEWQLATLEQMIGKKKTTGCELRRQQNIVDRMVKVCRVNHIEASHRQVRLSEILKSPSTPT